MRATAAAWILLALVAAPQVAADPELTAASARLAGMVDGHGDLDLLISEGAPVPSTSFRLHAQQLRLEVDHADMVIMAQAADVMHNPGTTPHGYKEAQVKATDARAKQHWILVPIEEGAHASWQGACLDSEVTAESLVERQPRVRFRERGATQADVSEATRLGPCDRPASLVVEGDFLLILWEWDITVESPSAEDAYWSGSRPSKRAPPLEEYQELFLYARGAVLELELGNGHELYVSDVESHVEGTVLLSHARGALEWSGQRVELAGESVYVAGALDVSAARASRGLGLALDGDVTAVKVDGQAVAPAATSQAVAGAPVAWLAVILVLVVSGIAGWVRLGLVHHDYTAARNQGTPTVPRRPRGLRQRIAMGYHVRCRRAFLDGDLSVAMKWAGKAIRWAPRVPEHRLLRTLVAAEEKSSLAILSDHQALDVLLKDPTERARNALEAAQVCRTLGDEAQEATWMEVARQACPQYVASTLGTGRARPQRRPYGGELEVA